MSFDQYMSPRERWRARLRKERLEKDRRSREYPFRVAGAVLLALAALAVRGVAGLLLIMLALPLLFGGSGRRRRTGPV